MHPGPKRFVGGGGGQIAWTDIAFNSQNVPLKIATYFKCMYLIHNRLQYQSSCVLIIVKPRFNRKGCHVGFVDDKVTPAQVFLQILRFYPVSYYCTFPYC
jgi:hypothetical protein